MPNKYYDWSSQEIEKLLILDRKESFVEKDLEEEFDRRCTEALEEVFEEICERYPNVLYPRGKRRGKPARGTEG